MDPTFDRALGFLFYSYVREGRFADALDEINRFMSPGWGWYGKAYVYGYWGRAAEAEDALRKLEQLVPPTRPSANALRLGPYIATGRKDQALAMLQRAYTQHSNLVMGLKVDPGLDPLRGDPRFQDLLRRLQFAK